MLLKDWVEGLSPWARPDKVAAFEHGARLSSHQDLYSVSKTNVRDLDDLGLSYVLYFTVLKRLVIITAACSVLVAPALYIFFHGEFFRDEHMLRLSLANFGPLYDGMAEGEEEVSSLADLATLDFTKLSVRVIKIPGVGINVEATDLLFYIAVLDVAAAWACFFATLWMSRSVTRRVNKHRRETTTIGKYSVMVTSIPECTKWDLVEYFDKFGVVVDMALALKDEEVVVLSRRRDACLAKLEKAVAKVQQYRGNDPERYFVRSKIRRHIKKAFALKEKVHKLSIRLKHLQSTRTDEDPTCCFVTYREVAECQACLATHGLRYNVGTRILSVYGKEDCFLGRHALRVSEAPEPADLLRENLEYTWYSVALRQVVVACLIALAVIASYLANVAHASTTHALSLREMNCTVVEDVCPEAADLNPDSIDALLDAIAQQGEGSRCLDCLCSQALEQTSVVSFQKYCSGFPTAIMLQQVSPYVGAVLVSIFNALIRVALVYLVRYEKHHTVRDQEKRLFHAILASQSVNTFISLVLANMSTPGLSEMLFPKTTAAEYMFQGKYVFLFPRWYEDVGSKIVALVLVNRLMYARSLAWRGLVRRAKAALARGRALTQREMNSAHEAPEFAQEAVRYGELGSIFLLSLLFSSGLPALFPVIALVFCAQYWLDKYQLLRVCRTPEPQGHVLANAAAAALPFCAVLHCGFAIAAFALYPMERSPLAEGGLTAIVLKAVAGSLQYVVDRRAAPEERIVETVLLQRHVVLFLISLVLMSLWLVLGGTWRAWVFLAGKLRDLALGGPSAERYMEGVSDDEDDGGAGVSAGVAREGEDDAPSFDIAVTTGVLQGLESYSVERNPKYQSAFRKIAWHHVFDKGVAGSASRMPPPLPEEDEEEGEAEEESDYEDEEDEV